MRSIEGQITINISTKSMEGVEVADIFSNRAVHASQVLIGKSPEQALIALPMLFAVCSTAQSRAGLLSIQDCLNIEMQVDMELARDLLVLAENAREHILRVVLDWPQLFEYKRSNQNFSWLTRLVADLKRVLFVEADAFSLNSKIHPDRAEAQTLISELETYLENDFLGLPLNQWLSIETKDALNQWIQGNDSVAAVALRFIIDQDWMSQGAVDFNHLPDLDTSELRKQFTAIDYDQFVEQPQWQKSCYETTSFTRQLLHHPILSELFAEYQSGLLTRWVARIIELVKIPQQMKNIVNELDGKNVVARYERPAQNGTAQIEAARGRLIHFVRTDDEVIKQYSIVAPTEWNFHPRGVVAKSLKSLKFNNKNELKRLSELVINVIDPCVGFDLRII